MTATSDPNRSNRYGSAVVDCGGAQVRAHCRHSATVVTVKGDIDALNTDAIGNCARRLALVQGPLIFDLSGVTSFDTAGVSMLRTLDADCHSAAVEWMVVASRPVMERLADHGDAILPIARSEHEALSSLAEVISARRELLLPLIRKTA